VERNASGFPSPVNRQISTSAQYYSPAVYGFGANVGSDLPSILSFFRDLTLQADPLAAGFVPMSAVPGKARNTKLFAIGILPPVQSINESLLLDRSEAVRAAVEDVTAVAESDEVVLNVSSDNGVPLRGSGQGGILETSPAGLRAIRNHEGTVLTAYRDIGGVWTIGVGHTGSEVVEGLVWTQGQADEALSHDIRHAEAAVSRAVKVPIGQAQFDALVSLTFNIGVGAFAKSTLVRMLNAGDLAGATQQFLVWNKVGGKIAPGLVRRRAAEQSVFSGGSSSEPVPLKADADSAVYVGFGSNSANSFRRELSRKVDMVQEHITNVQRAQLLAIKSALQSMMNTPPLRLLVNPKKFGIKSQKIVADGSWTRHGPIIEYWGDDQDKISGSGQVAAFYALDAAPGLGRGGPGLSRHARNYSLAWQNFQSLYLLYKNNGGMYVQDVGAHEKDVLLSTVGSVYIFYDNILYIGAFDSFSMAEADTKPFTLEYNFEFTARAAFLLEFPSTFNYGGARAFTGGRRGLSTQSGL
jgi:lysozyme